MIGGDQATFARIEPVFKDIAADKNYLYTGKNGSGHFLQMIHNNVEYEMMRTIAEGFKLLSKSDFEYNYDEVARIWSKGSVIRNWLMELT
ncbi:6-phosphogluconate dehydrogenase, NAD(+)-dependent, decarboxylating [compost metagenome]